MRKADIYVFGKLAGALTENDDGKFSFLYDEQYLNESSAVSWTSPRRTGSLTDATAWGYFSRAVRRP